MPPAISVSETYRMAAMASAWRKQINGEKRNVIKNGNHRQQSESIENVTARINSMASSAASEA